MMYAGLEVHAVSREDGSKYIKTIYFDGTPLDPEKSYKVATADTFTFGRLLPEIARSEEKHYFLPEFLRDLLAHTLRHKFAGH